MKKLLVIVLAVCFVLLCGCEATTTEEKPKEESINFILDSDWHLSDTEDCFSFGQPGVAGDYSGWDRREGKGSPWETGTYKVYTDTDGIVKEFARSIDECDEETLKEFDEQTSNLLDTIPFVLVIDLEPNDSPDAETGMKTHFEYYGLHDDDNMVLIEPGSGRIMYLWRGIRVG